MKNRIPPLILLSLLILVIQLVTYRNLTTGSQIAFPSQFLAQFYSPWSRHVFPGWENGIPHKPIGTDQIRFFFPAWKFRTEMLKNGLLPLWNPYIFSGNPFMADFQSAVFYPLQVVYMLLPLGTAWSCMVLIQVPLATVFMYLYLSRIKLSESASVLGALMFGLSGFFIVWPQENAVVGHAGLWLPLALSGIESFHTRPSVSSYLLFIFALLFSFLAGFLQITFYVYVFCLTYILLRTKNTQYSSRRLPLLSGIVLSLFLSGIQLVPSFEAFLMSPRPSSSVSHIFDTYLVPFTHAIQFLSPDILGNPGSYNFFGRGFYHETLLYIGIPGMLFAVLALFKCRGNRLVSSLAGILGITLILFFTNPVSRILYRFPIPLVSTFVPSRLLIIPTFLLSTLAAYGFDAWKKHIQHTKTLLQIAAVFLIILVMPLVYGSIEYYTNISFPGLFAGIINDPSRPMRTQDALVMIKQSIVSIGFLFLAVVSVAGGMFSKKPIILILPVVLAGQIYLYQKYAVTGRNEFLYPEHIVFKHIAAADTYRRFLVLGSPIAPNIASYFGLYSPEGLDPMYSKPYGILAHAAITGVVTEDIPRIEIAFPEIPDDTSFTDNHRFARFLALTGVKTIVHYPGCSEAEFPDDQFSKAWESDTWCGYTYNDALPRVYFADSIIVEPDPLGAVSATLSQPVGSKSAVVAYPPELSGGQATSEATISSYTPNVVEISAFSHGTQLLVLSDTWYPGWNAYIDGVKTNVLTVNAAFRGIIVGDGEHRVRFAYEPHSLRIGIFLSITGMVFLAVQSWRIKKSTSR